MLRVSLEDPTTVYRRGGFVSRWVFSRNFYVVWSLRDTLCGATWRLKRYQWFIERVKPSITLIRRVFNAGTSIKPVKIMDLRFFAFTFIENMQVLSATLKLTFIGIETQLGIRRYVQELLLYQIEIETVSFAETHFSFPSPCSGSTRHTASPIVTFRNRR